MKIRNIISALFAAVAVCAAAVAVYLSFTSLDAEPVLTSPPDEAQNRVLAFMDAVCDADYEQVSQYLSGNPSLGLDRDAADEVGVLLWDAYTDSLTYSVVGECYATDSGLAQKVTLTGLNITSVTAVLKDRSQALLEQRVQEAEDASDVYDENNEYREDFVMDVLYDAAAAALEEDAQEMTMEFTVNLVYQNDQWMVAADSELLDAISGGILY
ncbi:MAG: hypothetical protein IJ375_00025 [Oscillospiraceae bacterium]|nr:hypothetical protein [Oscillospiraceae bacterium]